MIDTTADLSSAPTVKAHQRLNCRVIVGRVK
jgi:hypothetical protein